MKTFVITLALIAIAGIAVAREKARPATPVSAGAKPNEDAQQQKKKMPVAKLPNQDKAMPIVKTEPKKHNMPILGEYKAVGADPNRIDITPGVKKPK